jgi:[protein-PII] uridylyltransferase
VTIKDLYLSESEKIFQLHRKGEDGFTISSRLSGLVDSLLISLWEAIPRPAKNEFAIMALGGYGRYEMCPHSDFDLMILFENEKVKEQQSEMVQDLLHSLWDTGFDVGHSVRTVKDCVDLYETDVDSWASILESRYVCGNKNVLGVYAEKILSSIQKRKDFHFVTAILNGIDERHEKYGNAVKLLEPNIKNSAGGLRDLHNLLWIYRSLDVGFYSDPPFQSNGSACRMILSVLERKNLITHDQRIKVEEAQNFLLRTRHEIHYFTGTIHDTIDFPIQRQIAKGLGYGEDDQLKYVERFMRDYYLHARNIFHLNQRLTNQYRKNAQRQPWRKPKPAVLDDMYVANGSVLSLRDASFQFSGPEQVLKAFYWCGVHSLELDQLLQAQLVKAGNSFRIFNEEGIASQAAAEIFLAILRMKERVAETLTLMNEYDVLGKFIPEWGDLVAFFQHSMYHYYTADAHTLIALDHAEHLATGKSVLSEVYRNLPRREVLFLALLLHDIEKPHGITEHEVRGASVARRIFDRWGYPDENGDVQFLVRHHLDMEQVAFRRNINDPRTVAEFAELFKRPEQLDLLFLLTYCDLSAVNKNVWTHWKEMLLQQLYLQTREVVERHLPYPEAVSYQQELHKKFVESLVASMAKQMPETDIEKHLTAIQNEAYIHLFTQQDIAEHINLIGQLDTVSTIIKHDESYSVVTAITRDAPFLLSNLCGVLSANDANIFDAHIFTRNDGIVIDQFRVFDVASGTQLSEAQGEKIEQDFEDVLKGKVTLDLLFEKHHRRWKRRPRPMFLPNIRLDVVFEDAPDYTIIDVYAQDTTGFLYQVTRAISKLGLNIYFAKIATRVDGIVDSFYVLDEEKKKVTSDEQKRHISGRILHRIEQMTNIQLTPEEN